MKQFHPRAAAIGALLLAAFFLGPLSAPAAHAQDAAPSAPPPGKALLYIFRSDRQPSDALVPVSVNAEIAGYLENGTSIAVAVNPGKTFLRSGDRVLATLAFEAAADRSYYVRVQAVHGLTLVQTEINLVDEPQGRGAFAQSRFMPSVAPAAPAQATAAPARQTATAPAQESPSEPAAQADSADASGGSGRMYVRLDFGFSKSFDANITDNNFANSGIIFGNPAATTAGSLKDVGGGILAGLGLGYRFSPHTRGDITVTLRAYQMNTNDASVPATNFKAPVASLAAMANGYLDFAASGVSPYIGAGIGFAMNRIGPVDFDDGAGFNGTLENGGTATGVAWSLMAGVAFPLSGHTMLDIGYRYSKLGDLKIDAAQGYDGASGKLNAHELTLGFRF